MDKLQTTNVISDVLLSFSHSVDLQRLVFQSQRGQSVTLVELPPYSPELNPIENLWHYLKSHYWSNRSYDEGARSIGYSGRQFSVAIEQTEP